ncbi:hypothetical protein [Streptomyces sp. NBC_01217]|uniref:hypothetical protein n=1 Tax=Streptomyces sp. NBC_01217 TaxID=2903779 RepID=UPI002E10E96A|nr:hypothetical protein OG507_25175 [Streptomyces sp. NBC_01217]
MADEHYEWLDKDVAEKMLRREPVDPVGGHPSTEAERLAAALDAVARAARPAAGELPGEAAALAAFRAAARSKGYAGKAGEEAQAPAEVLEPVYIQPVSGGFAPSRSFAPSSAGSGRTRSLRWNAPVRFGLVASFAGCALGGVAVAASAGLLPGPFGGHTPVPATSVSAAATPEELGSGAVADPRPPAPPSTSPEAKPSAPTAGPSAPTGDRDNGGTGAGGDRKPDGSWNDTDYGPQSGGYGDGNDGDWYARTLKACRDYRKGRLDDGRRRYLERLAKGAHNLDRFCDRVIAGSTEGQNGPGDDGGTTGGGPNDDGGWNGDDGDTGTLPPIRFNTSPPTPSPSPSVSSPSADRATLDAVGPTG